MDRIESRTIATRTGSEQPQRRKLVLHVRGVTVGK